MSSSPQDKWDEYQRHFHEIMSYVKDLKKRHGVDGKDVAIEDLSLRLARLRAGIAEEAIIDALR